MKVVTLGREAAKELVQAPKVRHLLSLKTGGIMLASVVGLAVISVLFLTVITPPDLNVSFADGASEIQPDSILDISPSRWGAAIDTVQVREARIAADGSLEQERVLDGVLRDGHFVLADGSNPLQSDCRYFVTVTGTVKEASVSGFNDVHSEKTLSFSTVITPMPVIAADGVKVRYGEQAKLEWNIPISGFEYRLEGINSTMTLDEDGKVAHFALEKFEQGKEYQLKITSATSRNGMELGAPLVTAIKTAPALQASFDPPDGTPSANLDVKPTVTFSEAVANPDKAQAVVSMVPQVEGTWNWIAPDKLQFAPTALFADTQNVTISIKGGPQGLRGTGGGFIDVEAQSIFTTAPKKSIDVDVTNQVVTLLENGKPVETILCSTGAVPHETPLGDFTIYAKLPKTDMRGPGYFAPAVPWVMVFKGDYTMHGNYWATAFGRPSSHGCVGMPVETAHHVYDWTPIGTPLHIHQ